MKIDNITFTNIKENTSVFQILSKQMFSMQREIAATLGANKKYAEAKLFLSKSNFLIAALSKAKDEDTLSKVRIAFINLCDQYKEDIK